MLAEVEETKNKCVVNLQSVEHELQLCERIKVGHVLMRNMT